MAIEISSFYYLIKSPVNYILSHNVLDEMYYIKFVYKFAYTQIYIYTCIHVPSNVFKEL